MMDYCELMGSSVKVENIWGQESLAEADRKDAEVLDRGEKREKRDSPGEK